MRPTLRKMALAGVLAIGSGLGIGASQARAHDDDFGYGYSGYGGFYSRGYYGGGSPRWWDDYPGGRRYPDYGYRRDPYRYAPPPLPRCGSRGYGIPPYGYQEYRHTSYREYQSFSRPTPNPYLPW